MELAPLFGTDQCATQYNWSPVGRKSPAPLQPRSVLRFRPLRTVPSRNTLSIDPVRLMRTREEARAF